MKRANVQVHGSKAPVSNPTRVKWFLYSQLLNGVGGKSHSLHKFTLLLWPQYFMMRPPPVTDMQMTQQCWSTHWFLVGVEEDDVLLQISGCHTHCTHLHCQLRVGHMRVTWQSRCIDCVITGDHHMITHINFWVFLQRPKHKPCNKNNQLMHFAHLKITTLMLSIQETFMEP